MVNLGLVGFVSLSMNMLREAFRRTGAAVHRHASAPRLRPVLVAACALTGSLAVGAAPPVELDEVLVWTFNENILTPDRVHDAAFVNPQYCKRSWFKYSGIPYDYFADPALELGELPPLLNSMGALFEGGVQVSDLHASAGWPTDSEYDDDHRPPYEMPDPVFDDFTTRDADGNPHSMDTIYGFSERHAAIANESYRDFVLFWAQEQIDRGVNALEFDVIGGGYRFSPHGTPGDNPNEGYEDHAIGTANLAVSLAVAYDRGTTQPIRWSYPGATASSAIQPAAAAFDDNPDTFWLSDDIEPLHSLEIDLGRVRTVQQIVVRFPPGRTLARFRLEGWSEAAGWRALITPEEVSDNERALVSFLVEPAAVAKVRLLTTARQAAVAELEVFGSGFRQYLLARYSWAPNDPRWETEKLVDLHDPRQCPDGTMSSFDYRGYLAAHGWSGNPFGGELRADNLLEPGNPLFLDWCPDHYFKPLDDLFRDDATFRQQLREIYLASYSWRRLASFWSGIVEQVRSYAASRGQSLFVTANGVAAFVDYILTGAATTWLSASYPAPSASDPDRTELDGRQAQLALWRSVREDALALRSLLTAAARGEAPGAVPEEVPVVTFQDFGYDGMPFRHLGGGDEPADERAAYLRTFPMEAYAAGVRFCFPVRANQERAAEDVTSDGVRLIDVIKEQTDFVNAHPEIFRDVEVDSRENRVTVNGIVPFNGARNVVDGRNDSRVNAAMVTVALTRPRGGGRSYLHVVNHNWDPAGHRMVEQRDVPVTVPVSGCTKVTAVAPDLAGEAELPFTATTGGVSFRLPRLSSYAVVVLEQPRAVRRRLRRQGTPLGAVAGLSCNQPPGERR